jgi:ankyrin repeat protein
MWAAESGHDAIVKQLLAAGADVNIEKRVIVIIIIIDTNVGIVSFNIADCVYIIDWTISFNLGSTGRI